MHKRRRKFGLVFLLSKFKLSCVVGGVRCTSRKEKEHKQKTETNLIYIFFINFFRYFHFPFANLFFLFFWAYQWIFTHLLHFSLLKKEGPEWSRRKKRIFLERFPSSFEKPSLTSEPTKFQKVCQLTFTPFFHFFPFYLSFSYLPLFKLPPPPLRYGADDILFHILVAFFPPLKLIRGPHRAFCTHFVVSVVAISRNNTKTNNKQKEGKQATALNLICCSRKTVYELPLVVNALKKKFYWFFLLANSVSRESERNNGFQKRASWIILLTTHRKNQKS